MLENDEYNKNILNWISIFRNKLMTTKYECTPFYALNKDFYEFEERRGNSNRYILIGNNTINPDKAFFILDEETWRKIKGGYPNEIELKVKGTFNNKKCVIEINNSIYYFYYIMNNNIGEGYFKFNNDECKEDILRIFFDKEVHDFIYKFKIRQINSTQNIYYDKGYFSIKIKDKNNKDNNRNENNKFDEWNNNNEQKNKDTIRNKYNNVNDEYILNKNKNKNKNKVKDAQIGINSKQNDNPGVIKNKNEYQNSLKMYKCAYYYFHFEQFLNHKCRNVLNFESLNLYLIDKTWMNYFKNHCNYDQIIKHLSSNIENFKNEHNIFCDYFARKYPLNLRSLLNKPCPPKKNRITEKEYFFDDYDFIDEQTLNIFLEEFNVLNANRIFKLYEVIIKNDIFIVIYDINNLEVMTKNDRLLFSVDNAKDLPMIKDAFKFSDYKKALRDLNIKDIYIPEQIMIDKMNLQIGKMRNLYMIMNENNNNQFINYNTENNFYKNNIKNDPMLNDYNYNYNNQNTLYQSYDKIPYNNKNNININTLQNYDYGNKNLESNSPKKGNYSGKKINSFYNFIDDEKDKQKIGNNNNINTLGETGYYFDYNKIPNINEERKNMQNNNMPINNLEEDQRNYYSNIYQNEQNTKLSHLYENNESGNKPNKYYLRNNSADPRKTYMDYNKQKENNLNLNYIDNNINSYNSNDNNKRRENIENSINFVNEYMESGKKKKINNKNNNNSNIKNNNINNKHIKKLDHYPNNRKSLYNNNNINLFNNNDDILNYNNNINNNGFDFNNNNNLNNKNIPTSNNENNLDNYNSNNYNFRGNRIILI